MFKTNVTVKGFEFWFNTPRGKEEIAECIRKSDELCKKIREETRMDWSCTCHKGGPCIHHSVYG